MAVGQKAIEQERWVAQLIGAACCVVGANPEVKSITVVTNSRPRYGQLAELRAHAATCDADFFAGDRGTVMVRRSEAARGSTIAI